VIPEPVPRWIFTLAFAAVGLFCLYRGARHGPATQRVSGVLHLALCAGMVAMAWPAATNLGRVPQIVFFAFAAVWFAGLLVVDARGPHERLSLGYHAVMPAAMVWMALAMPAATSDVPAEMPSGDAHAGMSMGVGTTMTTGSPTLVAVIAVVLTAAFAVTGGFWLVRAVGAASVAGGSRLPAAGLAADAVMGLGMAVMTGLLV
jgi:hypothetical protein